MAKLLNAVLFLFGETVEMEKGCFIRYWRNRPVAYISDNNKWRLI